MNDKITLINEKNQTINADFICYLEDLVTGARYVYYTLNEVENSNANGTVMIYVSKIKMNNPALDTKIADDEWVTLKAHMGAALKNSPEPNVKYLPISELANAVSVSDKEIAMPISYDYINKHKGVYAANVAMSTPAQAVSAQTVQAEPQMATPEIASAPTSVPEPTPVIESMTAPEPTPVMESMSAPEPTNAVTPAEPVPTVTSEPVPAPEPAPVETSAQATPNMINIEEIEAKYAKMIEDINALKQKEIEAVNRYNDTIKLIGEHNQQHANFVANEQTAPASAFVATPEPVPVTPNIVEPTPTPETEIETNWFDVPTQ